MRYSKITIFENKRRIISLKKFRNLVITYFSNITISYGDLEENKKAKDARNQINLEIHKITRYIEETGVPTYVYYSPPPATGGPAGNIDLLGNIFLSHQFQISKELFTDMIDKSIGVYLTDKNNSIVRTFNPFFWVNKGIKIIIETPFKILRDQGFEINDDNIFVKAFKIFGYIMALFTSLVTIFSFFKIEPSSILNYFK